MRPVEFAKHPWLWDRHLRAIQKFAKPGTHGNRTRKYAEIAGQTIVKGASDSAARYPWKRSTGKLSKSFKYRIKRTGTGEYRVTLVSSAIYARIQDQGGIIRPVKAKMLSIPLTERARQHDSPREMILSARRILGKLFLVDPTGKPQWILVHQVRVPRTDYLTRGMRNARRRLNKVLPEAYLKDLRIAMTKDSKPNPSGGS